ncbi:MAG: hypothetical protein HY722_11905 [Planctomycetes bacterium]|nr:hypothetical protein [Planctomycetota bacterium]
MRPPLAAALAASVLALAGGEAAGPPVFSHRRHFQATGDEGCAPCHGAASRGEGLGALTRRAVASCAGCHDGRTALPVEVRSEARRVEDPFPGFLHHDHRAHDCGRCHTLDGARDRHGGPGSLASACGTCHAEHPVRQYPDGARRCGACHNSRFLQTGDTEGRVFLHTEHLFARGAATAAECAACHATAAESDTAGSSLAPLDETSCHRCHRAEAGAAVQGPWPADPRPFHAPDRTSRLPGFSHRQHLRTPGGCLACHVPGEDRHYVYAPAGMPLYAGCGGCHAGWLSEVDEHGLGGRACSVCHGPDGVIPPTVSLGRVAVAGSSFGTVAHPFDPEAHSLGRPCERCHRRPPASTPSRIRNERFRHDAHLPAALPPDHGDEACLGCHRAAASSDAPVDEHGALLATCKACHPAGETPPVHRTVARAVAAVAFSHVDHRGRPCSACHVLDVARGPAYAPGVLDCGGCHLGHAAVDLGRRRACMRCHSGRDLYGAREPQPAVELDLPATVHDLSGECLPCHGPPVPAEVPVVTRSGAGP